MVAAGAVKQYLISGNLEKLKSYETAVNSLFGEEFRWARVVGRLFFSLKGLNFFMIKRSRSVSELAAELLSGRISYRESFFRYMKLLPGAFIGR